MHKNKATEKSDLDMAVIVETEQTKKKYSSLGNSKTKRIKPIDYHIFTRKEFLEMLKS